jgi:AraC family transcriptional regulator of adaptative response / DNA-3-methyladenine glycosylase II
MTSIAAATSSTALPDLGEDEMYAIGLRSDASYNGRFWFGVLTTGVYCLPSCRARKPYQGNVRYFTSVEEARAAGLRPCRKCYPDDFARGFDPVMEQIEGLAAMVGANPADFPDVRSLAARSGYGTTRLFELFRLRFSTTPADFLRQARIDVAKRLLEESAATIADVCFSSGFASISAFHANFKRVTNLTPNAYRCQKRSASK